MTYLADRLGARVVEMPIVFVDRRIGVSKMSRRIIVEALAVVLQLRWDELRDVYTRMCADRGHELALGQSPPLEDWSAPKST